MELQISVGLFKFAAVAGTSMGAANFSTQTPRNFGGEHSRCGELVELI